MHRARRAWGRLGSQGKRKDRSLRRSRRNRSCTMIMFLTMGRTMCITVRKRGHLRAETTEDISFLVVRSQKIACSNMKNEEGDKKKDACSRESVNLGFGTSEGNVPEGFVLRAVVALGRCLPLLRSSCRTDSSCPRRMACGPFPERSPSGPR